MKQQGEGRGGEEGGDVNNQTQDQRMKTMQEDVQAQPQPLPQQSQQPQQCPRCESLDTKFCYYNNYSLSQPRYFCKTCRRYWTQGGTLRNVPIGGGSRKEKRAKISPSSNENSSRMQLQPPLQEVVQTQPNLTMVIRTKNPSLAVGSPMAITLINPYYQGGGRYLSSLATIHSLNPSQPLNQSPNVGGDVGGSSNSALLSGFNVASIGSNHRNQHQHQIRPSQLYQIGTRDREVESFYPSEQGSIPSGIANSNTASHHDWPQSFINNANNKAFDGSILSNISPTSITGNSKSNVSSGSSSLIPNQWPDLSGYGPPI